MRRLTLALLCATYLCLSLIVALTLWRNGQGWGVALSSMMGVFGLCLASHGMIMRFLEMRELRGEVEAVRDAHRILLDQVVAIDGRVTDVARVVEADVTRATALTGEVHLLEQLVQKLTRRMDEPHGPYLAARGGQDVRSPRPAGLLETVREALAENRVDLYLQPVVGLPQRKTVFYESYSRLRDDTGRVMMPAEYLRGRRARAAWSPPSTTCCCSAACRSCAAWPARTARSASSATSPCPASADEELLPAVPRPAARQPRPGPAP